MLRDTDPNRFICTNSNYELVQGSCFAWLTKRLSNQGWYDSINVVPHWIPDRQKTSSIFCYITIKSANVVLFKEVSSLNYSVSLWNTWFFSSDLLLRARLRVINTLLKLNTLLYFSWNVCYVHILLNITKHVIVPLTLVSRGMMLHDIRIKTQKCFAIQTYAICFACNLIRYRTVSITFFQPLIQLETTDHNHTSDDIAMRMITGTTKTNTIKITHRGRKLNEMFLRFPWEHTNHIGFNIWYVLNPDEILKRIQLIGNYVVNIYQANCLTVKFSFARLA